jgi:hypothetical protein
MSEDLVLLVARLRTLAELAPMPEAEEESGWVRAAADAIERLTDEGTLWADMNAAVNQACEERDALVAEVARLRTALAALADSAEWLSNNRDHEYLVSEYVYLDTAIESARVVLGSVDSRKDAP